MKYVFVDMDGVIAEYGYPSGLYDGEYQRGNYSGKRPVKQVIDKIIQTYGNDNYIIMVCSASPNAKATLEKNEWLNQYFKVPYENRIFISPEEDKVEVIRYYVEDLLFKNVQNYAIIIDDKKSILAGAHSLGIECYHPTQLLSLEQQTNNEIKKESQEAVEANFENVMNDIVEEEDFGKQLTFDDLLKDTQE